VLERKKLWVLEKGITALDLLQLEKGFTATLLAA